MMYLDAPPRLIETSMFSAMPDRYRRRGVGTGGVLVADIGDLK
jgi:gluconolactonase